ncbi:M61 family metallopeptidase [Aliikangiella coralliicola]|uniref:M61 family metallopeptidase n=1 Tax=Aliikangiella coralliicola TaxID=2592383 RepID=A0A545U0F0_9GAMM|nr:PDZ domain-containing protein [Aliikangiella coralliicola]TQV82938.1 M61 family metallopeptidase [Aliikangiella coralliicola]
MIHYTVSFENANAHLFDVKLNINFTLHKGQQFYLPNWIPGSYMIRDFARNLITVKGNTKGFPVSLEKVDKSTWQLLEDVECLEINYQVYAWDLSVRSAHLDNQHGFFNGTSLFLGIKGYEAEKHTVILNASDHAVENNWQVATAMMAKQINQQGFGKYTSENYDELIDHPFEIGDLTSVEFEVFGVPHKMVFTEAPARVDLQRIAKDIKQICETEITFFGDEKPPFENYVFMTFVQKKGFGGLEHMASTALHCSFEDLPLIGDSPEVIDANYRTFLSLCCHEYFHSWNVKRIKPARFIPMDMSQEVHTELLWFFEGVTSYYDELLLARSKVIEPSSYLDMLAQTLTKTLRSRGRLKQTVTESSFDTWTRFYKQDENAVNAIVSYYTKGAMVALGLDFEIRRLSEGKKSLDDLMRLVWNQHGKSGKGVGETQIQLLAKELVGQSLNDFFADALYSTKDLDLKSYFESVDIEFQVIPQYLHNEKGGFAAKAKDRKSVAFLGITHKADALGAKVHSVTENSCAAVAGLSNDDIIIAVDNIRIASSELDQVIARVPIGTEVLISYFRRERLYHTQVKLTEGEANTCYLSFKNEKASDAFLQWAVGH